MELKWSNQRAMANSRIVKSSAIWLVIVPFAAKSLASLDDVIDLTIFSGKFHISTILPFSWQLLFFAACFFTLASIIYSVYCPNIIKLYENFSQFEADGKSRLQINSALREMVWDTSNGEAFPVYAPVAMKYLRQYTTFTEEEIKSIKNNGHDMLEDLTKNQGENSNAFYFVYLIADIYGHKHIRNSLYLYIAGYACIGVIAIQNIVYVVKAFC